MNAKDQKAFEAFLREGRPACLAEALLEVRAIANSTGADPDAVAKVVDRVVRAQGENYWNELDERGSLDTLRRAASTVRQHLDHMGTQSDLVEAAIRIGYAEDREHAVESVFDLFDAFAKLTNLIYKAEAPAKIDGNTNKEVFELVTALDECWPKDKTDGWNTNPITGEYGNPVDKASPAHDPTMDYMRYLYEIVRCAMGIEAARGARSLLATRARMGRRARRPIRGSIEMVIPRPFAEAYRIRFAERPISIEADLAFAVHHIEERPFADGVEHFLHIFVVHGREETGLVGGS